MQWDHDLAAFVPMGRGTVSEDRTQIITDVGSGISKGGWGGCVTDCPPDNAPKCATNPLPACRGSNCGPGNSCQRGQSALCQLGLCVPNLDLHEQPCPADPNGVCILGFCISVKVEITKVEIRGNDN